MDDQSHDAQSIDDHALSPILIARDSSTSSEPSETSASSDSLSVETDELLWSVQIACPPTDQIPRGIFEESVFPTLLQLIGVNSHGRRLAWPDRGWNSESEFIREITTGLRSSVGLFSVTRAQTKAEADDFTSALEKFGIPANVVKVFLLYSSS